VREKVLLAAEQALAAAQYRERGKSAPTRVGTATNL